VATAATMTKTLAVADGNQASLRQAVAAGIACLDDGELVVAPTETQYGLLGRADRSEVVAAVIRTKKRDKSQPLSVFVRDLRMVRTYATLTPAARRLGEQFLPGPLTLIIPADTSSLPSPVVLRRRLGFRISSHPYLQAIMQGVAYPLTATSANLSGQPAGHTIDDVRAQLGSQVALYVDDGALDGSPSTIVDASVNPVRILREGAVSATAITACLREKHLG